MKNLKSIFIFCVVCMLFGVHALAQQAGPLPEAEIEMNTQFDGVHLEVNGGSGGCQSGEYFDIVVGGCTEAVLVGSDSRACSCACPDTYTGYCSAAQNGDVYGWRLPPSGSQQVSHTNWGVCTQTANACVAPPPPEPSAPSVANGLPPIGANTARMVEDNMYDYGPGRQINFWNGSHWPLFLSMAGVNNFYLEETVPVVPFTPITRGKFTIQRYSGAVHPDDYPSTSVYTSFFGRYGFEPGEPGYQDTYFQAPDGTLYPHRTFWSRQNLSYVDVTPAPTVTCNHTPGYNEQIIYQQMQYVPEINASILGRYFIEGRVVYHILQSYGSVPAGFYSPDGYFKFTSANLATAMAIDPSGNLFSLQALGSLATSAICKYQ